MNTEQLIYILRDEASKCDQSDYKHQAAARLEDITAQLSASEQRVKELEKFEQQMKTLQALCGHIEDGSNDSVTLSQDDATGTWHITVGYSPRKRKSFWGESFDEVFLKAKIYVESTEYTAEAACQN